MRLIRNVGTDRVLDHLQAHMTPGMELDAATDGFSLFAFDALRQQLEQASATRLLLSADPDASRPAARTDADRQGPPDPLAGGLLGDEHDRERRNLLQARGPASELLPWLEQRAQLRLAPGKLPQSALVLKSRAVGETGADGEGVAITGDCPLTTRGLGLSSGNQFSLIQRSESAPEREMFAQWFEATWQAVGEDVPAASTVLERVKRLAEHETPSAIYFGILYNLFKDLGDELDEERIVKSATGTLFVCVSDGITREVAEPLALGIAEWQKSLSPAGGSKIVFEDNAFADDVAKTNLAAILSQHGLYDVRSL